MSLDTPDDADGDRLLDGPSRGPLTEEDILWAVELAASNIEHRSIERAIRAAATDADAIALARGRCRWWGGTRERAIFEGSTKGLWLRYEDREGVIPWSEVAARIRGTHTPPAKPSAIQVPLF
jgi:hypothetical protein